MLKSVIRKLLYIINFLLFIYLLIVLTLRFYLFSRFIFLSCIFVMIWFVCFFIFFKRKPLEYYGEQCSDFFKSAFLYSQEDRDVLIDAARLIDEDYPEKAIKLLQGINEIAKYDDDFYAIGILLGLCYFKMNLLNEVVCEFNKLKEKGLDDAIFYIYFGRAYASIKHYVEASDCFKKAIENEPNNPEAYFNLASLNFDLDDVMQAEYYAKKSLEKDKNYYHSISLLAMIYAKRNDKANTKTYYKQAVLLGENKEVLFRKLKRIIRENKV